MFGTLILCALAGFAILRAWLHGSIFENCRARLESSKGWVSDLLTCPLCLSYHLAFWLLVLSQYNLFIIRTFALAGMIQIIWLLIELSKNLLKE